MNKYRPREVTPPDIEVMVPDSAELVEVLFQVVPQARGESLQPVQHNSEIFSAAVNADMFSEGFRDASLRVTPIENPINRALEQWWRVKGLGRGAYRVFLNMLDVTHLYQTPLSSARLICSADVGKRFDRHAIIISPYPGRSLTMPFELQLRRDLPGTKDPLTRLAFSRDITNGEFEKLEELFTLWDHVITHGGYGHEYDELELDDSIVLGETYMASPDTLEHILTCSIGSPEAFNAQINMVLKLHHTLCPVLSFEIA